MRFDFIYILLFYLIVINLVSAVVCIIDKRSARRKGRRVSEKSLFALCLLGGSPMMYITMRLIRHKTKHKRFMFGIPIIFTLQIVIALLILSQYS